KQEEAVRIKAEQEAARIKAEAEAKAKQEAEAARIKAEQEAARIKAEAEAARIKAEQEAARIKAEAEAKAKQEAEVARIKAEQEAAQIKADAEARAKQAAEAARIKAEQEAARIKAEAEALRIKAANEAAAIKAEAEALRLKAEQEAEQIKVEAEAARINAEKAAAVAIAKAESDAAVARAEVEAKALAELRLKQEAETAKVKAAQEEARIKAAQVAIELEKAEAVERAKLKAAQDEAAKVAAQLAADEKVKLEIKAAKQAALAAAASITAAPSSSGFKIDLAPLQSAPELAVPQNNPQPSKEEAQLIAAKEEEARQAEAKQLAEEKSKQEVDAAAARQKIEEEERRKKAEEAAKAVEAALATEQADAWAEAEKRAKLQAGVDGAQVKQQAASAQKQSIKNASHRARRKPLPMGKILLAMAALSIAALFILPLVYPLQEYIAPIEQRLSAQLKQPVKVSGISAALLPLPKMTLRGLSIGAADEIKVSEVVLSFDVLTLLSDNKVINEATLSNVVLDGKRLEQWVEWLKLTAIDTQYPLRHVTLLNVNLNAEGIALPILKGSADIVQGGYTRVVLHSEDDKMSVELVPKEKLWQLTFGVKERALPLLPEVVFSDFNAKGIVGDSEINFSEIDAHIYGGILAGSGKLNWRKGWQVQGRMQAKTMELEKMFPQFGLAGEIFVDGSYAMQSAKLAQLGELPRVDGSFAAKRGVINGLDVVETARLTSHEHLPGGRTHFDEMTGAVQLENHNKHFRQIKITSGMLTASGAFDISSKDQLSGNLNAQIKMREGNNALTLSGTIAQPKLIAQ
ncbi:MAG: hypothetical protein HOP24_10515, partial [Sideroxydans sp.]|nr:hypothetical protein [Sideroxydans sp.]